MAEDKPKFPYVAALAHQCLFIPQEPLLQVKGVPCVVPPVEEIVSTSHSHADPENMDMLIFLHIGYHLDVLYFYIKFCLYRYALCLKWRRQSVQVVKVKHNFFFLFFSSTDHTVELETRPCQSCCHFSGFIWKVLFVYRQNGEL